METKHFRSWYFVCLNWKNDVDSREKDIWSQILQATLTPERGQQGPLLLVVTFIALAEVEQQEDVDEHPDEGSGQDHLAVEEPPHRWRLSVCPSPPGTGRTGRAESRPRGCSPTGEQGRASHCQQRDVWISYNNKYTDRTEKCRAKCRVERVKASVPSHRCRNFLFSTIVLQIPTILTHTCHGQST